jgi:hypothetical protein
MRIRMFAVVTGLALAIGVAASVGTAGASRPISPTGSASKGAAKPAAQAPDGLVTLFDNSTNDVGVGVLSQSFGDYPTYSSYGADDITVPAGHIWKVKKVTAYGVYFNGAGPATSEDVVFYTNKKGLPNLVKKSYSGLVGADSGGTFTITLPTTAGLSGGPVGGPGKTYWLSTVANMDFGTGGEWGWEDSTNAVANQLVWENPGGGFGVCPTWTDEVVCVGDYGQHSKMFTLTGKDVTP